MKERNSWQITIPSFSIPMPSTTKILMVLLLVAFYFLGSFVTKLQLQGNSGSNPNVQAQAAAPAQQQQAQQAQQQPPDVNGKKVEIDAGRLAILGQESAPVELVMFEDFQCPFCRKFYKEAFAEIKKNYVDSGKVKIAFRQFPLDFHAGAKPAALASECANEQGKFWEMHDKIFDEQDKKDPQGGTVEYTSSDLKTWAKDIGLNSDQFNKCLDSNKYAKEIDADLAAGKKVGVQGTPTTFVNGIGVVGAQPFSAFKTTIDKELGQ